MTGRRPLVAAIAFLVLPLPACLHINAQVDPATHDTPSKTPSKTVAKAADPTPATPTQPRILFAELPRAPGAALAKQTNSQGSNTVQKPNNLPPNGPPKSPETMHAGGTGGALPPAPLPLPPLTPEPKLTDPPLVLAVRAYAEGRPDRAIEIIRTLNPQNQDIVLALLPILARSANTDMNNDPATVAALVDQLYAAAARLEPRAALRIEKLAFCKDVSGFGRYEPWPDNQPYKPNAQAQLYLEVRNLGSHPVGNEFVTHVHAAVEVRDANGTLVEQIDPDDWRRRVPVVKFEKRLGSRSPQHDFHVRYLFSVPPTPGVYTVTVELRDATGKRTVKTQPVQFCVAGP